MSQRDLTVLTGAVKQGPDYTCLLTGMPCDLVAVTLRRMIVVPPLWIGWRAVVILPLAQAPTLAVWQYLRMLRPYIVIVGVFCVSLGLFESLDPKPGSPLAIGMVLGTFAAAIGLWIALGLLLDSFEFVRLLHYNNKAGTVTIRFSTAELAQQAREVMVLPQEVETRKISAPAAVPQEGRRRRSWSYQLGLACRRGWQRIRGRAEREAASDGGSGHSSS